MILQVGMVTSHHGKATEWRCPGLCLDMKGNGAGMIGSSLRILVVEDDFLLARKLAAEIRASGDQVVGPFDDVHDAMESVELAQAAILDVRVRNDTSFLVADSLSRGGTPFVFLTGQGGAPIPGRFAARGVYRNTSPAAPLLAHLHRAHDRIASFEGHSGEQVVAEVLRKARSRMRDAAAAERLVEAVLLRAIREQGRGAASTDLRGWLHHLLDVEHAERGRTHLH